VRYSSNSNSFLSLFNLVCVSIAENIPNPKKPIINPDDFIKLFIIIYIFIYLKMVKIIEVIESPRKGKRFRAILDDGKKIDFGDAYANGTYIDHHDKNKRMAYIARHLGNLNEKKLIDSLTPSPALFSMVLLWGRYDNIEDNIKYLNSML